MKAQANLGWRHKTKFDTLVADMVEVWSRWSKSGNVATARPEGRRQICPMSDRNVWRRSTSIHLPMR